MTFGQYVVYDYPVPVIVFYGYANTDLTVHVPELPRSGERVQARTIARGDGGMAANAAVAAARMGAHAGFAGALGEEPRSTAFLDKLADNGVDISWTAHDGRLSTAIILVGPDGDRAIISEDDALADRHIIAVLERLSHIGGGLLYLDGYRFPTVEPLLAEAENVRVAVDLDGCEQTDAALAALRSAEHVITGREQAALIEAEPAVAARRYRTNLLITDGARGWQLHTPEGRTHTGAAIDVPVRDTTGAGDCFAGVYLAELDRGSTPNHAARFAAAAASLSCTAHGARAGLPDRAQTAAYM